MLKKCLTLIVIAMAVLGNSACPGGAPDMGWRPKLYYGDAQSQSIVRKSGSKIHQIYCSNPDFNDRVCITQQELVEAREAYNDLVNRCEKWKY